MGGRFGTTPRSPRRGRRGGRSPASRGACRSGTGPWGHGRRAGSDDPVRGRHAPDAGRARQGGADSRAGEPRTRRCRGGASRGSDASARRRDPRTRPRGGWSRGDAGGIGRTPGGARIGARTHDQAKSRYRDRTGLRPRFGPPHRARRPPSDSGVPAPWIGPSKACAKVSPGSGRPSALCPWCDPVLMERTSRSLVATPSRSPFEDGGLGSGLLARRPLH